MPETPNGLVPELTDVIDTNMDSYRQSLATVQKIIASFVQTEALLGPALDLYTPLVGHDHDSEEEFHSMRAQANELRWALADPDRQRHVSVTSGEKEPDRRTATATVIVGQSSNLLPGTGSESAGKPGGRIGSIYQVLESAGKPLTTKEITTRLKLTGVLDGVDNPQPTIAANLSRGVKQGYFHRPKRGLYALRHDQEGGEGDD